MRLHFFTKEELPTKDEITDRIENYRNCEYYRNFIDFYYPIIKKVSNVYGMELFRLDFEEMRFIYQKHHLGITLEFKKHEKTNYN